MLMRFYLIKPLHGWVVIKLASLYQVWVLYIENL